MGQEDLTKQYSGLFNNKGFGKILSFVRDVYKSGKSREIFSFAVWELMHKLKLFPQKDYIVFGSKNSIHLKNKPLHSKEFQDEVQSYFSDQTLTINLSEHNWKLLVWNNDIEIIGCIYPDDRVLYKSAGFGKALERLYVFPEKIKDIFISSQNTIIVCVKGSIYRSFDHGYSFEKSLELGSPESFFRFNNAVTETPTGLILIGEYGNIWDEKGWRNLANIYFSNDDGKTWQKSEFLKEYGTNKHVHVVKYSRLLNRIFLADGDNYKKLWISDTLDSIDIKNFIWHPINKYHIQLGGYTSCVEFKGRILFGTDYQGGTNFIVETRDGVKFSKQILPDPYRRSPIDNMVLRRSRSSIEIWANLPYSTDKTKCLLMYSADDGKTWNKVFEYNHSTHTVWLISSSNTPSDNIYFSVEDMTSGDRIVYRLSDGSLDPA